MGLDMLMDCKEMLTNPHNIFNRVLAVRFKYGTKSITELQRHFHESPGHSNRVPAVLFKSGIRYVNELQIHVNESP